MKNIIVIGTFLALSSTAMADPTPKDCATKSEGMALGLSLGATAAMYGLIVANHEESGTAVALLGAGALLAPSLGHWYAGEGVTRGLGIRLAGSAVGAAGAMMVVRTYGEEEGDSALGFLVMYAGGALVLAGTIDDIVTAPAAARAYNERMAVVPIITADGGGLALSGRF